MIRQTDRIVGNKMLSFELFTSWLSEALVIEVPTVTIQKQSVPETIHAFETVARECTFFYRWIYCSVDRRILHGTLIVPVS